MTTPLPGLPPGLTLSTAGVISGTPTIPGTYDFGVQVTDSASNTASANLTMNITAPLSVELSILPPGVVGQPYTFTLTPSGGVAPYTWTESSS